jgi:hypothetical protein
MQESFFGQQIVADFNTIFIKPKIVRYKDKTSFCFVGSSIFEFGN